jgi:hypothetical protein
VTRLFLEKEDLMKRKDRINLVINLIENDTPQSSLKDAWNLVDKHLNSIENHYSGEIFDRSKYGQDGNKRMYLPTIGSGIYCKCGTNSWEINLISCQLYLSECGGIRIDLIDSSKTLLDKVSLIGGRASP